MASDLKKRGKNMNTSELINQIASDLQLGEITDISQLTGGFMHRMFKVMTDQAVYVIKLLNPNVMKRLDALENFKNAERFESILEQNNIQAVYALKFNGCKMQKLGNQYYYVFDWYDGKTLKDGEITVEHCKKIAKVLAEIHNIDLKKEMYNRPEIHIDWKKYVDLSRICNSPVYDIIKDKIDILDESMIKGNQAIKNIPLVKAICHNDMDSKNVLWCNDEFKLIDLECLGYSNPYLELFELALCWSGYESCNINFDLFSTFINSYFENSQLNVNIDFETLYYSNIGRLEWLEYNIKRALLIECDNEEEQQLGISEVKEIMKHIVYYPCAKNLILKYAINPS